MAEINIYEGWLTCVQLHEGLYATYLFGGAVV